MTYPEAIQLLYDLRLFGIKLGLEKIARLAELADHPQKHLRFIHVAGTNGKGSTCAMLESIYRAAGLRVGLFTSPHLVTFSERIQVNRQLITPQAVVRLVERLQEWLPAFPADAQPTFFEAVTVMALQHFAAEQCGLVIWETGMGGRFDATNIVKPLASVITNVHFDHEKWLGNTLEQIAFEKAGIIKQGVPAMTAVDQPGALDVIARRAAAEQAPLTVVTAADAQQPPLDTISPGLAGHHQKVNAAVALATVRGLQSVLPVGDEAIRTGLETVHWPGRLQVVTPRPGQTVLLDGAHNPSGAAALRAALQNRFKTRPLALLIGLLRDKDWTHFCELLAPLAQRIVVSPVQSERSADPAETARWFAGVHPNAKVTAARSVEEGLHLLQNEPCVVVTGSLHFVGEVMERLRVSEGGSRMERALNDWPADSPLPAPVRA